MAADSAVAREAGGAAIRVAPAEPRAFATALEAAARSPRADRDPEAVRRYDPGRHARTMQSIYAAAQSAVHLAL